MRDEFCRTRKIGTKLQGWKMRNMKMRETLFSAAIHNRRPQKVVSTVLCGEFHAVIADCYSVGAHTSRMWADDDDDSSDSDDDDATVTDTNSQVGGTAQDTPPKTDTDNCEVWLLAPRNPRTRIALVPCGYQRFCSACADIVRDEGRGCPLCRADITLILILYWESNCQTELNMERCKFRVVYLA